MGLFLLCGLLVELVVQFHNHAFMIRFQLLNFSLVPLLKVLKQLPLFHGHFLFENFDLLFVSLAQVVDDSLVVCF